MEVTLGCSVDDLRVHDSYRRHAVINVENPLYPGYLEQDYGADLAYLRGECHQRLILDGPYVDLNLGSPEPGALRLAQAKASEAIAFAQQCRAETLVFQSTFLPFIGLESYERGWIDECIRSWRGILAAEPGVRVALCNTFEFHPANLVAIVDAVDHPRFELAFDVGHCLVWGRLDVVEWYRRIRDLCQVVYVHSNDGRADEHRSIREGLLAETDILRSLGRELRGDSAVILKYFDKEHIAADINHLASILG